MGTEVSATETEGSLTMNVETNNTKAAAAEIENMVETGSEDVKKAIEDAKNKEAESNKNSESSAVGNEAECECTGNDDKNEQNNDEKIRKNENKEKIPEDAGKSEEKMTENGKKTEEEAFEDVSKNEGKTVEDDSKQENGQKGEINGEKSDEDVETRIVEQVEHYFGNINLPKDRFLREEIKKDDGWVPLTTMIKFNRLSRITADTALIAKALKDSEMMEVSDDNTKIRRKPALQLPENSLEHWQDIKKRTVYVKGFDLKIKLDEIIDFVKKFGKIDNVLMRRNKGGDRSFKGSVFVTFKTEEMAEKFNNNDVKEYNGKEIMKMMQLDYWAKKQRELKEKKLAARAAKAAKKAVETKERKINQETVTFFKGRVLSVENLPKDGCDLAKLKHFFGQYGDVQYAVFEAGNDKAQIRFDGNGDNVAENVWKAAMEKSESGKVMFGENELVGKILEGEEEEAYWDAFNKAKAEKLSRMVKKKRGKGAWGKGSEGSGFRGKKRAAEEATTESGSEKKAKRTVFADDDE